MARTAKPIATMTSKQPRSPCTRIAADESGATAIEYALLAAGIGIAVAAAVSALGTKTESLYAALAVLL